MVFRFGSILRESKVSHLVGPPSSPSHCTFLPQPHVVGFGASGVVIVGAGTATGVATAASAAATPTAASLATTVASACLLPRRVWR